MYVVVGPRSDCDILARNLSMWAQFAMAMPASWDRAGVSIPIAAADGSYLGRMLPGRGIYVDCDLVEIGIRRAIGGVFEYSRTQRLIERWTRRRERGELRNTLLKQGIQIRGTVADRLFDERGAISTYDGIINARATGQANDVSVAKSSFTTVANSWSSTWQAGGNPAAGTYTAIPGGSAPSYGTTGSLSYGLFNPSGGASKYLLTFGFTSAQTINIGLLVDLLSAAGNISANSTSAQTVNSTAITRNYTPQAGATPGPGVMMSFDVTTALGSTASNLTVTYTNQSGTASRTTGSLAMTASAIAQRLQPAGFGPTAQLQSGDYGVQSVQTVTFSAAMGAGVVALNLFFPLAFVPGVAANAWIERDSTVQIDGVTQLVTDGSGNCGCLNLYIFPNTTSSGLIVASMRTCAG